MFFIHFYWDVELEELTREKAIITAIQMDRQGHWLILVTWRLYFLFMSQDYLRAPIKPYSALDDLFSGLPRNRRLISKWIKDIQFEQCFLGGKPAWHLQSWCLPRCCCRRWLGIHGPGNITTICFYSSWCFSFRGNIKKGSLLWSRKYSFDWINK